MYIPDHHPGFELVSRILATGWNFIYIKFSVSPPQKRVISVGDHPADKTVPWGNLFGSPVII